MAKPKFKVWSKKAAEKASDDQLFFKLAEEKSGSITLHIVDKKGKRDNAGTLLHFVQDNRIFILQPHLSSKFGIRKDLSGHAEVYTFKQMFELQQFEDAEEKHMIKSCSALALKMPSELSDKLKEAIMEALKSK